MRYYSLQKRIEDNVTNFLGYRDAVREEEDTPITLVEHLGLLELQLFHNTYRYVLNQIKDIANSEFTPKQKNLIYVRKNKDNYPQAYYLNQYGERSILD